MKAMAMAIMLATTEKMFKNEDIKKTINQQ